MRHTKGVNRGFTLMEMLIVVAIIGVLATIAIPDMSHKYARTDVQDTLNQFERYKDNVEAFYTLTGRFPINNEEASMPAPDKLIGNNFIQAVLDNGAMHIYFGNKAHPLLTEKIISVRPLYVPDSPQSPISWICGYDSVPQGMLVSGENMTDITTNALPLTCRSINYTDN